jgi:hypothetical protein
MLAACHRTGFDGQITGVWRAIAMRRESQTFDFLLRQEKQAMLIGVPRRLPVTDGFMEGMFWR